MGDGAAPSYLTIRRMELDISRLKFQIEQHEFEKVELDARKEKIDENIAACQGEIAKQEQALAELKKGEQLNG